MDAARLSGDLGVCVLDVNGVWSIMFSARVLVAVFFSLSLSCAPVTNDGAGAVPTMVAPSDLARPMAAPVEAASAQVAAPVPAASAAKAAPKDGPEDPCPTGEIVDLSAWLATARSLRTEEAWQEHLAKISSGLSSVSPDDCGSTNVSLRGLRSERVVLRDGAAPVTAVTLHLSRCSTKDEERIRMLKIFSPLDTGPSPKRWCPIAADEVQQRASETCSGGALISQTSFVELVSAGHRTLRVDETSGRMCSARDGALDSHKSRFLELDGPSFREIADLSTSIRISPRVSLTTRLTFVGPFPKKIALHTTGAECRADLDDPKLPEVELSPGVTCRTRQANDHETWQFNGTVYELVQAK